jgi:hypothetical protein
MLDRLCAALETSLRGASKSLSAGRLVVDTCEFRDVGEAWGVEANRRGTGDGGPGPPCSIGGVLLK